MSELPVRAPGVNAETQPFWDGTAEGRIDLPVCDNCGFVVWYPRSRCTECRSSDLTWTSMAGTGNSANTAFDSVGNMMRTPGTSAMRACSNCAIALP